jgi:hypothetical protein
MGNQTDVQNTRMIVNNNIRYASAGSHNLTLIFRVKLSRFAAECVKKLVWKISSTRNANVGKYLLIIFKVKARGFVVECVKLIKWLMLEVQNASVGVESNPVSINKVKLSRFAAQTVRLIKWLMSNI